MTAINLVIQRQVAAATMAIQQSAMRLSTGLKVNSSRDNPSGLAIANSCKTQIITQNANINNINDYVSFSQLTTQVLSAINDAVLQKQSIAMTDPASALLDTEIQRLLSTKFNGQLLLSPYRRTFQVSGNDTNSIMLAGVNVTSITSSDTQLALTEINTQLVTQGSFQQSLSTALAMCETTKAAQTARYEQIMNVDTATEIMTLTKEKLLQSIGLTMLSMLNKLDGSVLSLLPTRNNY